MALLTPLQVADYWIAAGGPKGRVVEWVAIADGESGFNTDAVSSAGAIGLWQIMPFNAAPNGVTVSELYDPAVNASVAVAMSGHGTNCAAWDSCYADIGASGRATFLGWPEPGSADYANMAVVSVQLGRDKLGGAMPPVGAALGAGGVAAMSHLIALANTLYPALQRIAIADRMRIAVSFKPGWRP